MLAGYHFYCEVGLFVNFWAVRMRFRDWFEDETVFLNYLVEVFDGFCVGRSLIRNFFSLFVVLRVDWVGWNRSFDLFDFHLFRNGGLSNVQRQMRKLPKQIHQKPQLVNFPFQFLPDYYIIHYIFASSSWEHSPVIFHKKCNHVVYPSTQTK